MKYFNNINKGISSFEKEGYTTTELLSPVKPDGTLLPNHKNLHLVTKKEDGLKYTYYQSEMVDGMYVPNEVKENETLKSNLLFTINKEFETQVNALTINISLAEISTWSKQEQEAIAWLADNTVDTPVIDGILARRTKLQGNKQLLVDKIIGKANQYAQAVGALLGEKQASEDALEVI